MAVTDSGAVKKFISLYFTQLQNVRCYITGRDLQEMGVPAGPLFREILDTVLDARLNNLVQSRDDELRLARKHVK
jgi:tRNA nucleotidyltransferase (CCA-adding enzyme)